MVHLGTSNEKHFTSDSKPGVCEANITGEFPEGAIYKKIKAIQVDGAPSGIRTRDPLIKSQLLYQLS